MLNCRQTQTLATAGEKEKEERRGEKRRERERERERDPPDICVPSPPFSLGAAGSLSWPVMCVPPLSLEAGSL